jgi:hypothetical protein
MSVIQLSLLSIEESEYQTIASNSPLTKLKCVYRVHVPTDEPMLHILVVICAPIAESDVNLNTIR